MAEDEVPEPVFPADAEEAVATGVPALPAFTAVFAVFLTFSAVTVTPVSAAIFCIMNNGKAEALGFTVPSAGSFLNVPFTELKLQPGILIATIIRNQQVITPAGNDYMTPGDSVIVIANTEKAISNLTDIFADSEAGPAWQTSGGKLKKIPPHPCIF